MIYQPLKITTMETAGVGPALKAARLPKPQKMASTPSGDFELASKLVKAGPDHAKALRGCMVWFRMECQVGWLIEYLTYRIGIECLSSTSAMHSELRHISGPELAKQKQIDLPDKVYTRIEMASYQALRRIYIARKGHRHPDWQIFREFIESLPYFDYLIYPEYFDIPGFGENKGQQA